MAAFLTVEDAFQLAGGIFNFGHRDLFVIWGLEFGALRPHIRRLPVQKGQVAGARRWKTLDF
jgi:hypothetical protein